MIIIFNKLKGRIIKFRINNENIIESIWIYNNELTINSENLNIINL